MRYVKLPKGTYEPNHTYDYWINLANVKYFRIYEEANGPWVELRVYFLGEEVSLGCRFKIREHAETALDDILNN